MIQRLPAAALALGSLGLTLGVLGGPAGCSEADLAKRVGPTSIEITLAEGTRTGCEPRADGLGPDLLPFSATVYRARMTFQLVDADGQPWTEYNGRLFLRMMPGELENQIYEIKDGGITAPIGIRRSYGKNAHVWAEVLDEGGNAVAGVSPDFCFENPRLRDLQEETRSYRSPMQDQQVFVSEGTLLVTGISQSGFYLSDIGGCRLKPEWQPGDGSRVECSVRRVRRTLRFSGGEPQTFVVAGLLHAEGVTVYPEGGTEGEPYRVDEDYSITVSGGQIVVTPLDGGALPADGRAVVEYVINEHALRFASLYVFTFSAPFGLVPGSRVCTLQGGVTEFLGLTELGFPSYRVFLEGGAAAAEAVRPYNDEEVPDPRDDESFLFVECPLQDAEWQGPSYIPDPVVLSGSSFPGAHIPVYDDAHMVPDAFEAGLVRIENATLATQWRSCDLDGSRMVDRCYDQDREEGRCLENQKQENDCEMACATAGLTGLKPGERASDYAGCTEVTNYDSYGQFLVDVKDLAPDGRVIGGGRVNVNTRENIPEFDPRPLPGGPPYGRLHPNTDQERLVKGFRSVTGTLYQVNSARPVWMVVPRGIEDVEFDFVDEEDEEAP